MDIREKLSLGSSEFDEIINKNKIYVDKTDVIKKIIDLDRKYYFLSRPRRFGKSLLLNTFKELFKGNKELFEGLYIYDNWDWNKTYPVIHLDLNNVNSESLETFEESLNFHLNRLAKSFSIELQAKYSNDKLLELIEEVCLKHGKPVVVLIDEYDKPILDNINNKEIAIKIQNKLGNFYGTLKSMGGSLEFVFITGITKFSKVSVFSRLNNLKDLSLNEEYSTICGYTHEELEKYFKKFITYYGNKEDIGYYGTVKRIKRYYDGYSWDGGNFLYNPYSIMNFFDDNEFKNYWFESGTPNFLVKIFKENFNINDVYNPVIKYEEDFTIFDIVHLEQIPLLFQAGYLTIIKKEKKHDNIEYTLKIPNLEVERSITKNLFDNFYGKVENNFKKNRKEILKQIKNGKCKLLSEYLKKEITTIDYNLKIRDWRYYQTIVYFAMKALNFNTKTEIPMFSGRMDIAIEEENNHYPFYDEKGHIVIFEIKYTQQKNKNIETLANIAIEQIKKKGYWEKYEGNDITIIGLAIKEIKLKIGGSKIDMICKIEKIN
ncbi:MAG: ATP-binding protein [Methanobrevibacter sp.]|jgi:hypothetical protein|nr:ATP-binding protein [Candidatus Methanovirga aequatorialis]